MSENLYLVTFASHGKAPSPYKVGSSNVGEKVPKSHFWILEAIVKKGPFTFLKTWPRRHCVACNCWIPNWEIPWLTRHVLNLTYYRTPNNFQHMSIFCKLLPSPPPFFLLFSWQIFSLTVLINFWEYMWPKSYLDIHRCSTFHLFSRYPYAVDYFYCYYIRTSEVMGSHYCARTWKTQSRLIYTLHSLDVLAS